MKWVEFIQVSGRWTRQLASAGLLLMCVRFSWVTSVQAFQKVSHEFHTAAAGAAHSPQAGPLEAQGVGSSAEQKLKDMDAMLGELKERDQVADHAASEEVPTAELRRLVVDFGPERSDVYVRGRKVGKVPYAGQVHCRLGELVRVQVLPPQGLPITRDVPCTARASKEP